MEQPMILESSAYVGNDKIPKLVELVQKFMKQDVDHLGVDIGEKNVGQSINWKSIIVIPYAKDEYWTHNQELDDKAKHIIEHAKSMQGVERFAINILYKCSLIPIHLDDDKRPEYDSNGSYYNIIIPMDNNGYSIIDYKLIKNKEGETLVFDGQLPHGGMNDTLETRVTIFLNVNKEAFNVPA
jgi:hypothetical protein